MMESYCFTISLYHNVNRTTPLPHLRLRPHWSLARWKMCPWSALSSILGGPRKDMISCWNWILRKHIQYIHTTIQQTHKHGAERYLPRLAHDCRVWEHQVSPLKTRTDSGMGFIDQCQGFDLPMISWVEIHISGVHPTLSPWSPQRFWALCGSQGARPRLRLMWRIWTSNLWRARCGFRVYVNLAEGTMIYDVGMAKPRMNFCLLWKDWESFDFFFLYPIFNPTKQHSELESAMNHFWTSRICQCFEAQSTVHVTPGARSWRSSGGAGWLLHLWFRDFSHLGQQPKSKDVHSLWSTICCDPGEWSERWESPGLQAISIALWGKPKVDQQTVQGQGAAAGFWSHWE